MNYILHNLGYDNPINFRRIVLDVYKSHCAWLRDDTLNHLGLYDPTKWLPDGVYEASNLKFAKESYRNAKLELASLTKEKLQEQYIEELKKYEVLHNSENSYYMDLAIKARKCAAEYRAYLDKWLEIPDTIGWLTDNLIDIYDTAIKDAEQNEEDNAKAVKNMHNKVPPTYEEFVSQKFKHIKTIISIQADRIKSSERALKEIARRREEVTQLFKWLDEIEGIVKENDEWLRSYR